mgnify:CR=1 FL=1
MTTKELFELLSTGNFRLVVENLHYEVSNVNYDEAGVEFSGHPVAYSHGGYDKDFYFENIIVKDKNTIAVGWNHHSSVEFELVYVFSN